MIMTVAGARADATFAPRSSPASACLPHRAYARRYLYRVSKTTRLNVKDMNDIFVTSINNFLILSSFEPISSCASRESDGSIKNTPFNRKTIFKLIFLSLISFSLFVDIYKAHATFEAVETFIAATFELSKTIGINVTLTQYIHPI